jgi:NAD+ kinase
VKTIGVVARAGLSEARPLLRELVDWLAKRNVAVLLEEETARLFDGETAPRTATGKQLASRVDALLVLGGDGTLLAASQLLVDHPIPVLGVNFGSLGFLTEIASPT